MRKVDLVLVVGLLLIAGVLGWQQVTVSRLAAQVKEGMAGAGQTAKSSDKTTAATTSTASTATSASTTIIPNGSPAQLELVMQLARHSDRQVRQGAVLILGRLGAFQLMGKARRRVQEQLMTSLRLETDYSVLRALLKAVEDLDRDGYPEILLKVAATGSPAARRTAASLLSSKAKPGMGPSIVQLLSSLSGSDRDSASIRQYLIRALQRAPYPGAFSPLLTLLRRGGTSSAQTQIVSALAACATIQHGPQLLALLQEFAPASASRTNYTASYIIRALAKLGDIRATTGLLPYLDATSSSIRQTTIRALGQLRDPLAASALVQAYKNARVGSSEQRSLERLFRSGYPGVLYRSRLLERVLPGQPAKPPPPSLVSSSEMQVLLKRRAERLKQLVVKPELELKTQ